MTPDEQDQHRAADDGMPDRLTRRRRVARGTKVRSTTGERGGIGIVTGHDPDLDLPLVDWPDSIGPEALEDHEYEVIA